MASYNCALDMTLPSWLSPTHGRAVATRPVRRDCGWADLRQIYEPDRNTRSRTAAGASTTTMAASTTPLPCAPTGKPLRGNATALDAMRSYDVPVEVPGADSAVRRKPSISIERYRRERRLVMAYNSRARGPCMRRVRVILEPRPSASTRWPPTVVSPQALVSQVKERPGSSAVTCQQALGRRGCSMIASLPTCKGPSSTRRAALMLLVISGQRSTSTNKAHTSSGDASAAVVT